MTGNRDPMHPGPFARANACQQGKAVSCGVHGPQRQLRAFLACDSLRTSSLLVGRWFWLLTAAALR